MPGLSALSAVAHSKYKFTTYNSKEVKNKSGYLEVLLKKYGVKRRFWGVFVGRMGGMMKKIENLTFINGGG